MRRAAILLGSLVWFHSAAAQGVDWRGMYIGGFAGAAWMEHTVATELSGEWSNPLNPLNQLDRDALLPLLNGERSNTGAIGGVAAGYNWQFNDALLGVEGDFSVLGGRSTTASNVTAVSPYQVDTFTGIDWLATLRGRLGVAFDRSLVYVTGGLALGEPKFDQTITQLNFPYVQTDASNTTRAGWVVGAGLEHAFDDEWAFRLQYMHVDLGSDSSATAGVCPPPNVDVCAVYTGSYTVDFVLDSATAGVIYRFGAP